MKAKFDLTGMELNLKRFPYDFEFEYNCPKCVSLNQVVIYGDCISYPESGVPSPHYFSCDFCGYENDEEFNLNLKIKATVTAGE